MPSVLYITSEGLSTAGDESDLGAEDKVDSSCLDETWSQCISKGYIPV